MQIMESLTDKIEKKLLIYYGHMRRMNINGLPQQIWNGSHSKDKGGQGRLIVVKYQM